MDHVKYQTGSCIACGQGTDTALGVEGPAEWHVAFLVVLGVPSEQAGAIVSGSTGNPPGSGPRFTYRASYRVCAGCVRDCGAAPPFPAPMLALDGAEIPVIAIAGL